jgi:hypothetical protein
MSSDEQRAINSPIRRATTARTADVKAAPSAVAEEIDRSHTPQPVASQSATTAPLVVNAVADRSVVAASLAPRVAPAANTARPTANSVDAPAAVVKPVRQPIHHSVKTRTSPSESSSPESEKSPSPPAHAGSNEVQMF